ncbi:glycosyltransferase family 4 protein [Paenibacillus polymyxa]|uniref:glycosyltransferase family 4 protein n=1 Tax=Paenibacillus polymyxa TaxID=1406 RepID=UPI001580C4BD|nr:glycosyltransferase family 4 protein [Paenibacillus polymyxa]MBY0021253.1 glycosyltransferase family 4 protein [Paenibacillus polymyxa]MBY0057660.1 glycosyltransferase family 4 protein [Paenibacillus polymyxa]MBY0071098.1 glycosyltransferase family 4 protein [Paenibacillus polymyxa]MBY0082080.1 glycosyltransferase family 4 protein [Paenibacillus polymyxa]MBZ6441628.1 glycosyltransferase family 4 protein [Paenibacillus polymyxa]
MSQQVSRRMTPPVSKVLIIHNYYQQSGGEDKVVEQESAMLRSRGIETEHYYVHNDSIQSKGLANMAKLAVEAAWSFPEFKRIKELLLRVKPDVVHVHNFFPVISPSVYHACERLGVPVVQTLHNYRLICPAATFMRGNEVCEKCLHGTLLHSIRHGCYRGSQLQTIPVAAMIKFNELIGTWQHKVSRYIALTEFARDKFAESGIPLDRIAVKPNFIHHQTVKAKYDPNDRYLLFVGRISAEKGVRNLLQAWSQLEDRGGLRLVIIGDGPQKAELAAAYSQEDIRFLGKQDGDTVLDCMSRAMYVMVPSIWYEGFPMTIVESYSVGTPILCSRIGALEEIVEDGVTGFHFQHDDLENIKTVIRRAVAYENYAAMRQKVAENYAAHYTEEVNVKQLLAIYSEAMEECDYEAAAPV